MKKLLTVLFLWSVAYGQTTLPLPRHDTVTLFVIFGESNASGQALNSTAIQRRIGARPEILIQRNVTGSAGKFETLIIKETSAGGNNQIAMNSNTPPNGVFGMEFAMANMVDSGLLPMSTFIVKIGVGGTLISDWLPTGSQEPTFRPFLDSAVNQIKRLGRPYRIIVWESIGLNDAAPAHNTLVDSFVSRMAQHRLYWRTRYNLPSMQFLETNFSNTGTGYTFPYASAINAINATDPNFHSIPCNGATYNTGETNVHWNLAGLGTIAHNMLDTTLRLFGESLLQTDYLGPNRGAERWIQRQWDNVGIHGVQVPAGVTNGYGPNYYDRWNWVSFENTTQGVYNFSLFDASIHIAMDARQKFSFRIMPVCDGCSGTVPTYLQTLIEANGDPNMRGYASADGLYIPNWNNPTYIARYRALMTAVANHINTTSYQPSWSAVPIPFYKVINEVDIGGYGNFGEAHQFPWVNDAGFPNRIIPTAASLDSIIVIHQSVFPKYQAMVLIAMFGNGAGAAGTKYEPPTEVGYRALTSSTDVGQFGWRRDNWGDSGYNDNLKRNGRNFNGNAFQPLIMGKYKFGPVSGEPLNGLSNNNQWGCGTPYCDLPIQTFDYRATKVGNGNFNNPALATTQAEFQMASRQMGPKLFVGGGSMTTTLSPGGTFNISQYWTNLGLTPTYENWRVRYELRTGGGSVVWTGTSNFNPKPLQPNSSLQQSDNFVLGSSVAAGTYNLFMVAEDTSGYRVPLTLLVPGRGTDGFYSIRTGVVVQSTVNQPPVARVTGTQNVTLPGTASLSGTTSSDPDGTVSTYLWTFRSGPNTPTITTPNASTTSITGLIAGTYVIRLTVTDNSGAQSSTDWNINVNNANVPPTANITGPGTIQQPTSSITLDGSASSDPDGTISTFAWVQLSGPSAGSIVSPSGISTSITGLNNVGTYVFQLTVTDNSSANNNTQKTVIVNQANLAPVAQVGSNFTVQLPINSIALDGSTSYDPDGTVSTYLWTQLSGGPNTATITNGSTATATMSNLIAGVYNFKLTVTDNQGATGSDTAQVTVIVVNPASALTVFSTQTPPININNDGQPLTMGMKFRSNIAAIVVGARFYKVIGNNGTHQAMLYDLSGNLLAQATFTNETSSGWQEVRFGTPVTIKANTSYMITYFSPGGYYIYTAFYFNTPTVNNTLTGIADGVDGFNGMYQYGPSPTFPLSHSTSGGGKTNYWVDVLVAPEAGSSCGQNCLPERKYPDKVVNP